MVLISSSRTLATTRSLFLDYQASADRLARYKLVYVPNTPCLSESQCVALAEYVAGGGTLVATHLTSTADEYGRPRNDYRLSDLLGAKLASPQPLEIPDLYLRLLPSQELIPQDPQVMPFKARDDATVLAETYSRSERRALGPAIIRRRHGKGQVIYIGSGLEAIYEETLLDPCAPTSVPCWIPFLPLHEAMRSSSEEV